MRGHNVAVISGIFLSLTLWVACPLSGRAAAPPVLFTALETFTNSSDGNQPLSVFVGPDDALYGMTYSGGPGAGGTIFKMNLDGSNYTTLQSFSQSQTGNSNAAPQAVSSVDGSSLFGQVPLLGGLSLTVGNDGYLYGTTLYGGINGNGTIFRLSRFPNSFTNIVLDRFTNVCDFNLNANINPVNVIQAKDGSLFGTTWDGRLFTVPSSGGRYVLSASLFAGFCSSLVQGSDGAFYGTTVNSEGTVFKFNFDTNTESFAYTVLTNLTSAGLASASSLIQGSDGYLYLTPAVTALRGLQTGVCRMRTDGSSLTLLHQFTNSPDGWIPMGLVEGMDGRLYGTTMEGGANGLGTVYGINPGGGSYNVLYDYGDTTEYPMGGLAVGSIPGVGGILYGATTQAASKVSDFGTIYGLTVNPPLSITPATYVGTGIQTTVFWPTWASGYGLQYTTNLASGNWVTPGWVPQIGSQNGVPVQYVSVRFAGPSTVCFRIVHP